MHPALCCTVTRTLSNKEHNQESCACSLPFIDAFWWHVLASCFWGLQVLERVAAQAAVVLLPVLELASQEDTTTAAGGAAAAAKAAAGEVDAAAVQLAAAVLQVRDATTG